jgi:hypothetical protein
MTAADASRWAAARTLPDLAALCIAWLDGDVSETPLYEGPPCEDKASLAAVLTAVNRAGYVTDNASRAGSDESGEDVWNAWIEGFAGDATEARLREAVRGTSLTYGAYRRPGPLRGGIAEDWDAWMDLCPSALHVLYRAWYVVIEDPRPGRDDLLWPALEAFAAGEVPS